MKEAHREIILSFKCSHCNKSFLLKPSLPIHMRIRHGEKLSECKESFHSPVLQQKTFARSSWGEPRKLLPIYEELFGKPVVPLTFGDSLWREPNPYCCDQCQESFSRLSHLQQHSILNFEEKQESDKFRCVLCIKAYSRVYNLKTHMKCAHPGTI
jgi:KRAB domain-containing zinc finger protein